MAVIRWPGRLIPHGYAGRTGIVADGITPHGEVISRENERVTLRVEKADTAKLTARLLADLPVIDLAVEDPPIEEVIERVFAVGPEE